MLIAATVLFATISFVLYQKSPSVWLLSSRLQFLLTGTDPCNQTSEGGSTSSLQDGSSEKKASNRDSNKKNQDKENKIANGKPFPSFSLIDTPTIQAHNSGDSFTNSEFRLEDNNDDNYTPSVPSPTSSQRASRLYTKNTQTSSTQRDAKLMPPPPAPPQPPQLVNTSSIAAGNRTSQLASTTRQARIADTVTPTRHLNSLNTASTNTKSNSNMLMVPPSVRPPQNLSPTNTSKAKNPRQKIILKPGRSPLDWANLSRSGKNLSGVPMLQRVRPSNLKYNNGRAGKAAWSSYRGKVYNVTPFLPYHPGGEGELMRAAGKDGGKLFMDAHPWVSWENMLEDCLVGILVSENDGIETGELKADGEGAMSGLDDIE